MSLNEMHQDELEVDMCGTLSCICMMMYYHNQQLEEDDRAREATCNALRHQEFE